MKFSRRQFLLGGMGATAAVLGGGGFAFLFRSARSTPFEYRFDLQWNGPLVEHTHSARSSDRTTGDDFARAHASLWNPEAVLGRWGLKAGVSTEETELAVLGGGVSGLLSAYFLRDRRPVLLEYGTQLGGNSRGETDGELAYSIGAAYIPKPEPGSAIEQLLREIGVFSQFRFDRIAGGERVLREDRIVTRPAPEAFSKLHRALNEVHRNHFPEVPFQPKNAEERERFERWDSMTLKEWATETLGGLHPEVQKFLDRYGWSAFGGGARELSAWQALNFLAADQIAVGALPGGNSGIAKALAERIEQACGPQNLRTRCLVVRVALAGKNRVEILYQDPENRLRRLLARRAIVAFPKFVAKRVVADLPMEQKEAMQRLEYRAYLVANVILKERVRSPAFELFTAPESPEELDPRTLGFTDLVYGNWASEGGGRTPDRTALTFYRALPYRGGRAELFSGETFQAHTQRIEKSIARALRAHGVSSDQIETIRYSRYGHALPLAAPGLLSGGVLQRASKPVDGRIFFANQDNFASPCFESAFAAAKGLSDSWM